MLSTTNIISLLAIVAYLGVVLFVGFRFAKRNESTSDFYLGGRKLGPFVTAMSAEASDMSSWLLMGLPGLAYVSGMADAMWTAIGLAVGTYVNWLFVAKRLRQYTQKTESFTLPQFFSNRFRDKKNILCMISALVIIIFFIPYTASGFAGCGKLFHTKFGIDYMAAMIITAAIIIIYTSVGGFLAASTTDFIQSIIMTVAIGFVLIFSLVKADGIGAVLDNAKSLPGYFSMTSTYSPKTNTSSVYGLLTIITTLSWGLGYFGMPHILLRFMAIEDENKLKLSRRVASIWVVIAMCLAIFIGIVGNAMAANGSIPSLFTVEGEKVVNNSETIIVEIANLISSYGIIPAFIAGLVLAGILASTMSTADSQLLAASSCISQNILQEVFHVKISKKASMIIARVTVVVISAIAIFLAKNPESSVFKIVSFSWAGFGAAFGPLVLCSLFWKRTNLPGAIAGMVSGGIMVFVWKFLVRPLGGLFDVYELLPAFLISLLFIVVVSLLTKAPGEEIQKEFDEVKACN